MHWQLQTELDASLNRVQKWIESLLKQEDWVNLPKVSFHLLISKLQTELDACLNRVLKWIESD